MADSNVLPGRLAYFLGAQASPGTNRQAGLFARPQLLPNTTVTFGMGDPEDSSSAILGSVNPKNPYNANINYTPEEVRQRVITGGTNQLPADVLTHELTHIGQHLGRNPLPSYSAIGPDYIPLVNAIRTVPNYYGGNVAENNAELGANLVARESSLPKGQSWFQTPEGRAYIQNKGRPESIYQLMHGTGVGGYITPDQIQRNWKPSLQWQANPNMPINVKIADFIRQVLNR